MAEQQALPPVARAIPQLGTPPPAAPNANGQRDEKRSASKTVTDTIIGEHEHTIIGYSLVKGIGDGEPIASERFTVGGHEWVLLFYPDGKRSSSSEAGLGGGVGAVVVPPPGPGNFEGNPALPAPVMMPPVERAPAALPAPPAGAAPAGPANNPQGGQNNPGGQGGNAGERGAHGNGHHGPRFMPQALGNVLPQLPNNAQQHAQQQGPGQGGAQQQGQQPPPQQQPAQPAPQPPPALPAPPQVQQQQREAAAAQQVVQAYQQQAQPGMHPGQHPHVVGHARREATNEYAALFVALIGESDSPQGVVNTSDGRVVRAFHRFTLVDQSGQGRDLMKGRSRAQGAVKISCARQDPNARNCHGYRKFVKRSVLENLNNGYLVNDTIVIKYTIELVVSTGGALTRQAGPSAPKLPLIQVPGSTLGAELAALLDNSEGSDISFKVEDEELPAHRIILTARSPVFRALLNSDMREGKEGVVVIEDVRAPVFRALLHFVYTDVLPEELEGANLDVAMAQHLLVAADRFQLSRLRRICERRLCETVEVESVATTLSLAEQNHAEELKRVCLEFVSRNLQAVMLSEGYQHMVNSCPQLQAELLHVIAVAANERQHTRHKQTAHRGGITVAEYAADAPADAEARRVRQRRE